MSETPQQAGFEIDGRFYAFPDSFALGDPVLVKELTGMPFTPDFTDAVSDPEFLENPDPTVLIGLVGVAVWQGNPRWKREKVVQFVSRIDFDKFEAVGGDEEEETLPPAVPAGEPAITSSDASSSDDSQDKSTEPPSPSV